MKKLLLLASLVTAFLCSNFYASAQSIQKQLKENSSENHISHALIETLTEINRHTSKNNGVEYIYLQSQIESINVHNQVITVIRKNGTVLKVNTPNQSINFRNLEKPDIQRSLSKNVISSSEAVKISLNNLGLNAHSLKQTNNSTSENTRIFEKTKDTAEEIKAEKVFLVDEKGNLVLVWKVFTYTSDHLHAYETFVNAYNGTIEKIEDNVVSCSFGEPTLSDHKHRISREDITSAQQNNVMTSSATYNVFDLYVESPNHGNRSLVQDPWLRAGNLNSLPDNGWHSTSFSNYTTTKGNNVDAFVDWDDTHLPTDGNDSRAESATFDFDFMFDDSQAQNLNKDAAVTNLFFWNNITHDVLYKYGFDEASGNFQYDNFGNGGLDEDFVVANAQDGALLNDGRHLNNANFFSPADGNLPRMQMYNWSPAGVSELTLNGTTAIQFTYVESNVSINNKLENTGAITGDLVLVEDTNNGTNEACTSNPFINANDLVGNIAVIRRGNCPFTEKILNAQNAGAIGVIVINNAPGNPGVMGGDNDAITIPAVMISQSDGDAILNSSAVPLNVTISPTQIGFYPDGDFDNGIIAHEYAHGLSIRLTGGASTSTCLNNEEQMGEGWSDFVALMLVTDWNSALGADSRGIGTYPSNQPTSGSGIRTYPYSTDMSINPFTYNDIKTEIAPHGVGSVWATMLWDLVWEIEKTEGISNDIYSGEGANGIVFQLVVDGLKNQACSPGFVNGRDAILLADELNYNGQYKCAIWRAFAKRGLGYSANQGSSASKSDGTEAFDLPTGVEIEITSSKTTAHPGETIEYTIDVNCQCSDVSDINISNVLPAELLHIEGGVFDGTTVTFPTLNLAAQASTQLSYTVQVRDDVNIDDNAVLYDFEDGLQGWQPQALSGDSNWLVSTVKPYEGQNSLQGPVEVSKSNLSIVSPEFLLSNTTEISFMHSTAFNLGSFAYEGGLVQITTDNGLSWEVVNDIITENPYNASGSSITDYYDYDVYSGDVDYLKTTISFENLSNARVDNSDYGKIAKLRFISFSDKYGYNQGFGWVVDNVQIGSDATINNVVDAYIGNQLVDTENAVVKLTAAVLPVELGEFSVKASNNDALLNWNTLTENNNSHFNIQRSLDGKEFTTIHQINGAGNSQLIQNYSYKDSEAAFIANELFYRLEQVDYDGTNTYTKVESIEFNSDHNFSIYPNPAKQGESVVLQGKNINQVNVYSVQGRLVQSQKFSGTNSVRLDISAIESGVYFIVMNDHTKQKLVIQ